jgi:hypothetical protein
VSGYRNCRRVGGITPRAWLFSQSWCGGLYSAGRSSVGHSAGASLGLAEPTATRSAKDSLVGCVAARTAFHKALRVLRTKRSGRGEPEPVMTQKDVVRAHCDVRVLRKALSRLLGVAVGLAAR